MNKVLVINEFWDTAGLFRKYGWSETKSYDDADVVLFTGGADIGPELYGEKEHLRTYTNPSRDKVEVEAYEEAIKRGIPMVGICRGAQLLCALSGGKLYQDVNNHSGGDHVMVDVKSGRHVNTTSIHHQMCILPEDGELIAYATEATRKETYDKRLTTNDDDFGVDVEVFYIERTQCLGFQGHPEYSNRKDECSDYFFECIGRYIKLGVEV